MNQALPGGSSLRAVATLLLGLAGAVGGCGSNGKGASDAAGVDSLPDGSGDSGDGSADAGGAAGGGGATGSDGPMPGAGGASVDGPPVVDMSPGEPLPNGPPALRRLLDKNARLTRQGSTTCSHQVPASGNGDRFCVFMKPGAHAASTELWVINVSRAARGEVPRCDGSDPHCLRMTTNLWSSPKVIGGPVHPYSHEFHGDTLIFYADPLSGPDDIYRGPIYAWRPGWSQPRRISSPRAVICFGDVSRPLAYCMNDFVGPALYPEKFLLGAGSISDAPDLALRSLGFMRPVRGGHLLSWQAGWSPDGSLFVLSSSDPDPMVETVRVVGTSELGQTNPRQILNGAGSWELSRSGSKIFYYRLEPGMGEALFMADFPSGANEVKLTSGVRGYQVLRGPARDKDAGLIYLGVTPAGGVALNLLRDLANPAGAVSIFSTTGILEGIELSGDLRFTAWVDASFNLRVVDHGDLASCDLNTAADRDAFAPSFSQGGGLAFWIEDTADSADRLDGWMASTDGCQKKFRYAANVDFALPVGDRTLLFGDEPKLDVGSATLKLAALGPAGEWPAAGATTLSTEADASSLIFVERDPLVFLFRVTAGGGDREGIYVYGPLPE